MAAIAGGAITVGGGLVSAAAGCGSSNKNTTSSAQGGGTQVSSSAEKGDEIKLGYVVPITGALAPFASGATWAQWHFEQYVGQGIVMGDKKLHPIKVYRQDTQSSDSRAGSVTGDLINNTGVDLVLAAGTPDTVNPAVVQAENNEAPFISNWCEWHAFVAGAPKGTYQWGYTFAFDDVGTMQNYAGVLATQQTNKVLGLVLANDTDGKSAQQFAPKIFEGAGYKVTQTDLYNPGSNDFTAEISSMKKAGCEILVAAMLTPDFTKMWTQAHQQGFKPKVAFGHKGLIFPESVEALGNLGYNLLASGTWTPRATFKDSLTGKNCQQIADEYETYSANQGEKKQWSEALIISSLFEWAVDIFKNVPDPKSKDQIVAQIKKTNISTILGKLDFTLPVKDNSHHPHPNCCVPVEAVGQWVKATSGPWPLDKKTVFTQDPTAVAVEAKVQPLVY
jgi:branched-chain amino acid transport system substrate-binding protein